MAKKDVTTNLDIERKDENSDCSSSKQNTSLKTDLQDKTEVKNAHATGLGSIGRSDQKTETPDDFNTY
jgi:hypothetical protein